MIRARVSRTNQAAKYLLNIFFDGAKYAPNKRSLRVTTSDGFYTSWNLMWSGGSRDYVWFIQPATGQVVAVSCGPTDAALNGKPMQIPADRVVLVHSSYCGKDEGITVYLPKADEVTLQVALDALLIGDRDAAQECLKQTCDTGVLPLFLAMLDARVIELRKAEAKAA